LGACIGGCPVGAISLKEYETEAHSEQIVKEQAAVLQENSCACQGIQEMSFGLQTEQNATFFRLRHFPIQLHLINPNADFLQKADLVLAADCTAFAYGNIHNHFLKNNCLAIACPKLDNAADIYVEKLTAMIDYSSINTLSVIMMEVPCCSGLLRMAQQAQANAKRRIPIKKIIVGIKGNIQSEDWM
jgi:ferredoxin